MANVCSAAMRQQGEQTEPYEAVAEDGDQIAARADTTSALVLVVEDMAIVAMELEDILLNAGFRVLGPAASVAGALSLLARKTPDVAVLDVNLANSKVTPVAEALVAKGIPFVIASAHVADALATEPVLATAPNVGKPTDACTLIAAVRRLIER